MRNVTGLVSPAAGVNNCRENSPLRRVRGGQRRRVPWASCGCQTPQVRDGGRVQQDFQGLWLPPTHCLSLLIRTQRFCREIIGWKRLSHPNILPLLGVSVSADPQNFRIVSDWMRNGNVMEYTRSNPEVNRLRLVSPPVFPSPYDPRRLSALRGHVRGDLPS